MLKYNLIFLVLLPGSLLAQPVISRYVIATAGHNYQSGNIVATSTIGEPIAVANPVYNGLQITQGFQQPELNFVGFAEDLQGLTLNVFPNPTKSDLTLEFKTNTALEMGVQVMTVLGTSVYSEKLTSTTELTRQTLNLEFLASGSYLVVLTNKSGEVMKSIGIQKVQ